MGVERRCWRVRAGARAARVARTLIEQRLSFVILAQREAPCHRAQLRLRQQRQQRYVGEQREQSVGRLRLAEQQQPVLMPLQRPHDAIVLLRDDGGGTCGGAQQRQLADGLALRQLVLRRGARGPACEHQRGRGHVRGESKGADSDQRGVGVGVGEGVVGCGVCCGARMTCDPFALASLRSSRDPFCRMYIRSPSVPCGARRRGCEEARRRRWHVG